MAQGQVRIIGGEWRGRKLTVPDVPNLRPTPDRVRETLFNWLAPLIAGAHCLDAFAGSGVLGFEAASRGASSVVMIDDSLAVVKLLQQEAEKFQEKNQPKNIEIYRARLPNELKSPDKKWDIVFLDPPYQQNLLLPMCFYLEEKNFLAEEAYIYLEAKEAITENDLPKNWRLIKSKKAGQVAYHLALRQIK
jgi:16S rRNA (guanine966-N2)-methyltransferase